MPPQFTGNQYTRTDPAVRFWAKTSISSGCWLWTGAKNSTGYGSFALNGKEKILAHHFLIGKPPAGLEYDHLCHTKNCQGGASCPHRSCVNPMHLEAVTSAVNSCRGNSGRHTAEMNRAKTHCLRGHPFIPSNTYTYGSKRFCKSCMLLRARGRHRVTRGPRLPSHQRS